MTATATSSGGDAHSLAGRQLGRYEVLTQLAAGGMAAVYIARAQGVAGFERLVAIKVLHPHLAYEHEFISMFLDEARLAARIRHPNVVATLDISDSQGDGYFLVMDYIEGDHLGALLGRAAKRGDRLPTGVVLRVLIEGLAGLGAAHVLNDEHGEPLKLVHRDVSPHNLMVGTDGIARLTDFGVAKAEVRMASTRAGQFKGKLSYMAPEQASTGEADQRSDLFSMGIILWESLTGRRLFRGENNAATLTKVLHDPVPMPSELWPELAPFDPVLARALDRDPDARFQTADEFIEAIENVAPTVGGVASPRQVSNVVKDLLAEKLVEEKQRVRSAIDQLGRSQIGEALLPIPRDGSASASASGILYTNAEQTSPTLAPEQPKKQRNTVVTIGAITAVAVVGLILAFRLGQNRNDEDTRSATTATTPTVTVTPTEPVALPSEPEPVSAEEAPIAALEPPVVAPEAPAEEPIARRPRERTPRRTTDTPTQMAAPEPTPTPAEAPRRTTTATSDLFENPYRR